ncbi:MAG: hypothetical protein QOD81_1747 [Solirubrobacteraceae bacterium]|jgi:uncharacterized protein|nr:hypothetical protein [Solirubrobacteraceae bacterium]
MAARTDILDLGRLRLTAGEGRRMVLGVSLGDYDFAGERYAVEPPLIDVTIDISRMTAGGYALRMRFEAGLSGPCMRCLEPAAPVVAVDVREIDQPGGGDELKSPYVTDQQLDVEAWARDAYALALPNQVICTPDCAGLCPECGENLNTAGDEHHHEAPPDPRWAKLRELKFD